MFIIQIFYLSNLTVYASADGSGLNKQQPNRHNSEKEKIIKHEIKSNGHNSKNNKKDNDNGPKDDESKIKLSSNEYQSKVSNSMRRDYGNPKYNGNFRKPLNRNREDEKVPRVRSGRQNDEKIEHLMNQKLQVRIFLSKYHYGFIKIYTFKLSHARRSLI